MLKLFLTFLLIPTILFSGEQITPYLTSECDTLSLVEGLVNAYNGKIVQIDNDIYIDGSDPLEMTRYYDGGHNFNSELGYGMGDNFPTLLQFDPNKGKQNLYVEQRKGLNLIFNIKGVGKKLYEGKIDPSFYKSGYTNHCEALLRGEPSLHTLFIEGNIDKFILHLGNGTKRHYEFFVYDGVYNYRLTLEERPNGNRRHYSYHNNKQLPVKRIWTTNSDDTLTLNSIDFTFSKNQIVAKASNGQKVTYHLAQKKGKASNGNILSGFNAEYKKTLMTDVEADHLPSIHYDPLVRSHYLNTIFSLQRVIGPDDRSLEVDYNKNERVKKLYLNGCESPFYSFDYDTDETVVKDGRGAKTKYVYSDRRIKRIEENHRIQKFQWSKTGDLESYIISDPNKNEISKREYQYDGQGNILRIDFTGNITDLKSKDQYYVRYKYSGDRFNLLLSENHNDEREITYGYVPNTNLIASKHTFADQSFVEKEFFKYDKNGILIKKIIDDGGSPDINDLSQTTYRLVTEIIPQLDPSRPGLTLPSVIKESYVDPKTGQQHLLKRVEKYYTKGDLLAEEKIFDSEEKYQYSLYYEYNYQRQMVKSINAVGETTLYDYDANFNKVYEEKLGTGKKTFYIYDKANQLIEEIEEHTDGTKLKTSFSYDIMGNRTQKVDHFGNKTTYEYDLSSRETSVTDPLGFTEYKKYDEQNHIIEHTDNDGYTTKTINNLYGSPLEIQYADGTSKRFQYNLQGHLVKEWERDGTFSTYQVDYKGRSKRTDKYSKEGTLLKTLQYTYKGNNLTSEIDGMGHETQYTYDGAGRLISKIKEGQITTYIYDTLGRIYKTICAEEVTIQKYDNLDRVIEKRIEDLQGNILDKEEYYYDIHGNRSIQKIYSDITTFSQYETRYNSHNLPERIIDPLGNESIMTYTFSNHLEKETIDPLGRITLEHFDHKNRVKSTEIYSPYGTLLSATSFEYDGRGNPILQNEKIITDGGCIGNYQIQYTYDSMGHKVLENEQSEKLTYFTYKYGRLESIVNPDGIVISYIYDPLGRLQVQISSDGTVYNRYSYDNNDNVIQAEDLINNSTTYRGYDALDQLIYEKQAYGFEIFYTYDALNHLKEVKFDNNKIVYSYSPKDLVSVSRYQDTQLKYTYSQKCDWRGKPILQNFSNNLSVSIAWDKLGRCNQINSQSFSQLYNYDSVGNLIATSVTDPIGKYDTQFSYDDLNQIISETGEFNNVYVNDSLFNRRSKNEKPYDLNNLNQVVNDTTDSFAYDKNGRRTQKNDATYTYDGLGRLTSYNHGNVHISYQYDPFGRLIKKNDQVYRYQLDTEIGTENEFRLVYGKGSTFAIELDGECYFPIRNHRGDICVLSDGQSKPVGTYRYDAFGTFLNMGTILSPWLFSSQRYDDVTNLYHYDKREYDPALGRWLTPDPLGFADGPNLYAYVSNNPLIYVDPYGLWREHVDYFCTKTKELSVSTSRGFTDWTCFTDLAFGQYECKTWTETAGYYTGYSAGIVAGLYNGSTELKIGIGAGKLAVKAGKFATSYVKSAYSSLSGGAKAVKTLNETNKFVKVAQESSAAIQKTGNFATSNFSVLSTIEKQNTCIPIWSNTSTKTSVQNAYSHWVKHRNEFPDLTNSKQYVEMARDLLNNPNSLSKIRPNGDIIRYHRETNTFNVYSKDGIPKTMFKPDPLKHNYKSNLEYFHGQ